MEKKLMYDELVKAIRQNTCHFDACGMCPKRNALCMDRMALQAADAIEELSAIREEQKAQIILMAAEGKPSWIPVTERKPNTDDIVIVAIHDDSGDTPYDVTNVGFYLDVFPLGVWVVENERCNYVTHWMPLPQAPKEET